MYICNVCVCCVYVLYVYVHVCVYICVCACVCCMFIFVVFICCVFLCVLCVCVCVVCVCVCMYVFVYVNMCVRVCMCVVCVHSLYVLGSDTFTKCHYLTRKKVSCTYTTFYPYTDKTCQGLTTMMQSPTISRTSAHRNIYQINQLEI